MPPDAHYFQLGPRTNQEQEDISCRTAEQSLLEPCLVIVSAERGQALLDLLDQPPTANPGLQDLYTRNAPWETA